MNESTKAYYGSFDLRLINSYNSDFESHSYEIWKQFDAFIYKDS